MPNTARKASHLRLAHSRPTNVEERLVRAFPEIDLEKMISPVGPNNRHNVTEQWRKLVGQVESWVTRARSA